VAKDAIMNLTGNLSYDVFINEPPPQDNGLLPTGEPKEGSPVASTLIYGNKDAVLTDPGFTEDQARALGDWVAAKGLNVTEHSLYWKRLLTAAAMTAAAAWGGETDG
jgi:hypothetical protein